ncbi:MAG: nucleotidyltransferase domain-containing protein [Actinobacteria bacterium]|nr:nucleotidyltransferase domain-containing protein [Actinomycetota bacterium]
MEAASRLDIELSNLAQAAERTAKCVDAARAAIANYLGREPGHDGKLENGPVIVAFGSIARQEMAPDSDFDYLVILNQLESDPQQIQRYRQAANEALKALDLSPPGRSGLFGCAISGTDLVNTIGLDADTNLHLSRRILLLEESLGLNDVNQHERLVEAIVARYLHEHHSKNRVPRFLLNDVIRYWRTIAVDYQAKRWDAPEDKKLGLRYVKLITSRKLTFAGMIASLFFPAITNQEPTPTLLAEQCALPEYPNPLDAPPDSIVQEARQNAEVLQTSLENLFYSTDPIMQNPQVSLGSLAKRYLSF